MKMNREERRAAREREQYFTSFWQEVGRLLNRTGVRIADREDCAAYISEWVLRRERKLVSNYTPAKLAAVCTSQRAIDFIRMIARQNPFAGYDTAKGEARLKFVSFDAIVDPDNDFLLSIGEMIDSGLNTEGDVVSNQTYKSTIKKITDKMTPTQKTVYIEVEMNKMKVVEVAEKYGLKREYTQRRLGEARKIARDN